MPIRLLLILQIFIATFFVLDAQEFLAEDIAKFSVDGRVLANPFAGGMNAPQFSNVDFNNDGISDVLIFDRIGSAIMPMIRDEEGYTFDPSYIENFPQIEHFLLMKDYNADGIADIFCYSTEPGVPGISVYKGKYTNNRIDFDLFTYPNYQFQVLNFELANGSFSNIAVLNTDVPSIEDIDSDGDLDIVTFNFLGGYVEYYQNLVVERGESLDGFYFLKLDDCYGGVFESGQSEEVLLAESSDDCANTFVGDEVSTRHAGSTLLSIDYDEDGDYELLLGDLAFTNVTLLENGGTIQEAYFDKQILRYPNDVAEPVDIPIFPGAYYTDIDGDGVKDFVAAPNNINSSLDTENAWYYHNIGKDDLPVLELESKNLFGEDMVDLGTAASPTFADVNADGLLDLIVGTQTKYVPFGERDGRLYLFLNVGTSTAPSFDLVDDNWLDFQRYNSDAFDYMPTFADLDSDGDLDLFVGETNGHIYYGENTAQSGMAMQINQIIPNYLDLDVGQISAPIIYDADRDGLLDFIVGERNGNINFLKNIGTATNPNFSADLEDPVNVDFFGQIDTRIPSAIVGYSKPAILETEDGTILITGSGHGALEMYALGTNLESEFELLNDFLGETRIGEQIAPTFADINNDGFYEAIIGNRRGGLSGFSTDLKKGITSVSGLTQRNNIKLKSNLVSDYIEIADQLPASMTVYSTLGVEVLSVNEGNRKEVSGLVPGIYFILLERNGEQSTQKFVKQ